MIILFNVFLQISRFLVSNSQLRIHKMMTDCLHYKDYARDAIKLVVQKPEGGVVDGKRGGKGPPVEMWPGAPSNLKTALAVIILMLINIFQCLEFSACPV